MKKLKLDHDLAAAVKNGDKKSTWRLYDDKDIAVGDTLELIDKVDAQNPESWQPFGTALVDQVIEKRLRDINTSDMSGHGAYESMDVLLADFRAFYGPQVTLDTPVKIIHFTYRPPHEPRAQKNPFISKLREIKLFTDGGSRGNPGPSASGFAIFDMNDSLIAKEGVYLGVTTNNQAEYQALEFGLEQAKKMNAQEVHVFMDSMLVVNQMKGIFKVKNRDLWPIHEAIKGLAAQFKHVTYTHVPRELNKIADGAVNDALDAAAPRQ